MTPEQRAVDYLKSIGYQFREGPGTEKTEPGLPRMTPHQKAHWKGLVKLLKAATGPYIETLAVLGQEPEGARLGCKFCQESARMARKALGEAGNGNPTDQ